MEELLKQTADLVRERITGEIVTFDGQTKRRTRDKERLLKLLNEGPNLCEAKFLESTEKAHGKVKTTIYTTLSSNDHLIARVAKRH